MENRLPELHGVLTLLSEEDGLDLEMLADCCAMTATQAVSGGIYPAFSRTRVADRPGRWITHLCRRVQTPLVRPLPSFEPRDADTRTILCGKIKDAENILIMSVHYSACNSPVAIKTRLLTLNFGRLLGVDCRGSAD
jgi:hypothetical protein